jgi:undecaprenyl-diphosphatase
MEEKPSGKRWATVPLARVFLRMIEVLGAGLFAGLITAIISAGVFVWLADEVFEGSTKLFDSSIRETLHQAATPALTQAMMAASFLGSFYWLFPLGLFIFVLFLVIKWKRDLVLFLLTMAGEQILDPVLKNFFQRARPEVFFDYPLPTSYSFPSGHAFASLCFYGILAWLITTRLKNPLAKTAVWIFAALLIFSIGLSRIYLGVHYPSDVVAGYLMAFIWVVTIALGDLWFTRRRDTRSVPGTQ